MEQVGRMDEREELEGEAGVRREEEGRGGEGEGGEEEVTRLREGQEMGEFECRIGTVLDK